MLGVFGVVVGLFFCVGVCVGVCLCMCVRWFLGCFFGVVCCFLFKVARRCVGGLSFPRF